MLSRTQKTLVQLSLIAAFSAPVCGWALGVGQIHVRSSLNEPFDANIPLVAGNPAEVTALIARIPRQQDFDDAGVDRSAFMSSMRFVIDAPPGAQPTLHVTSAEPIRDPNFQLLVELVWPRGRMVRTFHIQLDPALYAHRHPAASPHLPAAELSPIAAIPSPKARPEVTLPEAPPVSFEGATPYGPVKSGETLAAIAKRTPRAKNINTFQMMAILMAGNPEAFAGKNPSQLRVGATLKVPTPEALGVKDVPAPTPITKPAPEPVVVATTPTASPTVAHHPVLTPPEPVKPPLAVVETPAPTPTAPPAVNTTPPLAFSSMGQPQEIIPQPAQEMIPQPAPQLTLPAVSPAPVSVAPTTVAPAAPIASTPPTPTPPVAKPQTPAPTITPAVVVEEESSGLADPLVWIALLLIIGAAGAVSWPFIRQRLAKKSTEDDVTDDEEAITALAAISEQSDKGAQTEQSTHLPPAVAQWAQKTPPNATSDADTALGYQPTRAVPKKQKGGGADPATRTVFTPAAPALTSTATADTVKAGASIAFTKSAVAAPTTAAGTASRIGNPSSFQVQDLPSELGLGDFNFDLSDLGLEKPAQKAEVAPPPAPKSDEKPAFEMDFVLSPARSDEAAPTIAIPNTSDLPSLALVLQETRQVEKEEMALSEKPKLEDLQFEFTTVAAESVPEEPLSFAQDLGDTGDTLGDDAELTIGQLGISSGSFEMSADYLETKLDLATAYVDMGDHVGARSLLEDVLHEGNAAQKERAEKLIQQLQA